MIIINIIYSWIIDLQIWHYNEFRAIINLKLSHYCQNIQNPLDIYISSWVGSNDEILKAMGRIFKKFLFFAGEAYHDDMGYDTSENQFCSDGYIPPTVFWMRWCVEWNGSTDLVMDSDYIYCGNNCECICITILNFQFNSSRWYWNEIRIWCYCWGFWW